MKSYRGVRKRERHLPKTALLVLLATNAGWTAIQQAEAATNVVVWDTFTRLDRTGEVADKAG